MKGCCRERASNNVEANFKYDFPTVVYHGVLGARISAVEVSKDSAKMDTKISSASATLPKFRVRISAFDGHVSNRKGFELRLFKLLLFRMELTAGIPIPQFF